MDIGSSAASVTTEATGLVGSYLIRPAWGTILGVIPKTVPGPWTVPITGFAELAAQRAHVRGPRQGNSRADRLTGRPSVVTSRCSKSPGMMLCQDGAREAGLMSLEGLSVWVNRVIAWADRLQRRHSVLGFPYAVVKKYGDDEGGREAALITYYGFLSIFPLLLLGVAVLSRVLADHPDLRQRLITAIVPQALRSTVEHSVTTSPTSTIPSIAGLIGLLFSGTGAVFSVHQAPHGRRCPRAGSAGPRARTHPCRPC
jgi:hypothetical protein